MMETITGDGLTKQEMKQRNIIIQEGTRGGVQLQAPTYQNTIAANLIRRGFLEDKHTNAACDYLELKNSVFGFLAAKTIMGILKTGESSAKREHAEAAYYIACRHIGKLNEKLILQAMYEEADKTLELISVVNAYQSAFDSALDAMELAISKIREQIEKDVA